MAIALNGTPALTIGDVAAATGMRTSAVRYYESEGLLPQPARASGKRRYDADTIDRLLLIRFCRRLGFGLPEIRGVLTDGGGQSRRAAWRRQVDARLVEVRSLIRAAKSVERVLRESRDCDCVTLSSCRFLRNERVQPPPSPLLPLRRGAQA
ncbi:MAG TPA: MerR family transcriptional regulator [Candidatus Acidoferrum sp.]|nr:MerR family transcriptional regulator [Candidatus Acidoferrum sp.]